MEWIDGVAILPDFKMQHGSFRTAAPQLCDHLSGVNVLPFLHQNLPVVGVSTQIVLVMIHDNEVTVTKQPVTGVDHISSGRRFHSITGFSRNINTFIDFSGC